MKMGGKKHSIGKGGKSMGKVTTPKKIRKPGKVSKKGVM